MKWLATAFAISVGLIVLLDYFFDHPLLNGLGEVFREWAIVLTAFALLLGLFNLFFVHALRIVRRNEPGVFYSIVVVVTTLGVLLLGLWFDIPSNEMNWIFNNLYLPLQSAFFALTAFFLATAAYRALRARNFETTLMLLAAVVVFLGQLPFLTVLEDFREWVLRVPSQAGVRGILLGVAIGTIATALRLLVGMDRPYSE
ncbi:MAG: hypothetical protein HY868_15320 [Chloroflexi bacterium]|nr:hypothetical protein [Chloroflexota bacterium]